jgi:hypothetical protein
MTRTQRTSASEPVSLTSTQKSPIHSLPGMLPPLPPNAGPSPAPMQAREPSYVEPLDLRRPEMRSPAPRPPGTPRSLWVPILVVLIVGLAGTAVWLWLSNR